MPMFTYTPRWEEVRAFFEKFESLIPKDYSGLAAIRLHRTGYPISVELYGKSLPEAAIPPVVLFELKNGEPTRSWDEIQDKYDVPWARESDHHQFRSAIMDPYHAEDILEARAEEILKSSPPDPALLRKSLFDHALVLA